MTSGGFKSQFDYFRVRNNAIWFEALPAISAETTRSATNLSGTYKIVFPNPQGVALNKFSMFDDQEIWFTHIPAMTSHRVMAGQINNLNLKSNFTLSIEGRGLSGLLTDKKISSSWTSKRGDFILCDPTFGVIPTYFPNVDTWKAFTDEYDRFDYWDSARWGSQPDYTDIIDGELEIYGDAGETRTITGATAYNYEAIEFYAKVSAASATVRFGFTNIARTQYVEFELKAASVDCSNNDGVGSQSTSTPTTITQTGYNYYRIEWDVNEIKFFVNGNEEVVETANIPSGNLYPFFEVDQSAESLSAEYVKVITPTSVFETYVANDKIAMDVVEEIMKVGNSSSEFSFYIGDDWDFNAYVKKSVSSGYSFGLRSSLYNTTYERLSSLSLNEEAKDLYNYVKITGGEVLNTTAAPAWTDEFIGNGTQTAFALGYKAKKPLTLVEVDSVAKTEGTDFTVTYGTEHTIVQFDTAPANTKTVNLRYDFYTPIIAIAYDETSIQENNNVERYYTVSDETITSQDRAQKLADALKTFYTNPRAVIKCTNGLDPRLGVGKTVQIDAPDYGISDTTYEIIELTHSMAIGRWETTMTLASSEINTSGEIIREILQQLKDLKNRGETDTPSQQTVEIGTNIVFERYSLTVKSRAIGTALIGDHSTNSEGDAGFKGDGDGKGAWSTDYNVVY